MALDYDYAKNHEEILKAVAFLGLLAAGIIELQYGTESLLEDPFVFGAAAMVVASLVTYLTFPKMKRDFTYPTMWFFLATKIVAQITHAKHYTLTGLARK